MRIVGVIFSIVILCLIAGIGYVAISDVPIEQKTITRDISAEVTK